MKLYELSRGAGMLVAGCVVFGTFATAKAQSLQSYSGNAANGFGGEVGGGSLTVSNDGVGNVTLSLNLLPRATSTGQNLTLDGNDFVLYVSTGAAGLSDTSTLTDNGDGGRESVSGYNANNTDDGNVPTRTLVQFPTGFQATYAISFEQGYVGLFQLPAAGSGSGGLVYIDGANQSGNSPFTVTLPLSELGLTQGQTFQFDGSLIATSTYRSNEVIGGSTSPDLTGQDYHSNLGYTSTLTFTGSDSFSTPEPSSVALLAFGGLIAGRRRRRGAL